jgi:hypothetical protein
LENYINSKDLFNTLEALPGISEGTKGFLEGDLLDFVQNLEEDGEKSKKGYVRIERFREVIGPSIEFAESEAKVQPGTFKIRLGADLVKNFVEEQVVDYKVKEKYTLGPASSRKSRRGKMHSKSRRGSYPGLNACRKSPSRSIASRSSKARTL